MQSFITSEKNKHGAGVNVHNNRPQAFFGPVKVRPKLTISADNDPYEREADAVSDKVMRMSDTGSLQTKPACINVQRKCAACEEEEKVQMKGDHNAGGGITAPASVNNVVNSAGRPLDNNTRRFMESRLGYDFAAVQVHDDTAAQRSSSDINALAYTHGNHIVFAAGQYKPGSSQGDQLLAHELVHVMQQGKGKASQPEIQRMVNPGNVSCNKLPRSYPIFKWMGTDDPATLLAEADGRAIDLINKTIDALVFIQGRIAGGLSPSVPTFNDCMAESLHTRLLMDPENINTWNGTGPGTVNHFINLITRIRNEFQGGLIRFICHGAKCEKYPGAHALVVRDSGYLIQLCQPFWIEDPLDIRALILIHEFAHVYFLAADSGRGPGNSHCINGFIADINGLNGLLDDANCRGKKIMAC